MGEGRPPWVRLVLASQSTGRELSTHPAGAGQVLGASSVTTSCLGSPPGIAKVTTKQAGWPKGGWQPENYPPKTLPASHPVWTDVLRKK